ncbi:MAG: DNA polymerase [Puniceicoccaceae bacterium]|nr:DNA polymerase [Puniceicoccaceae bacterium]
MALRYLFIDFDSFYASVEQAYAPRLRGRPVAVVPSLNVDTTSCIAASYEAKAQGVKTGTSVREARALCPKIQFVQAKHEKYVAIHNKIHQTIHEIIFVDAVLSIDEMYGRLPPKWQSPQMATEKAQAIKQALKQSLGTTITASIGIASNRFIAKLASKMNKPDGLKLIEQETLPEALSPLDLSDITGIGKRMQLRLNQHGIFDVASLCQADRSQLHRIWGSIEGDRFWYALRGIALPEVPSQKRSIGHSHVLPPALRSESGALATLHRMLEKACHRLRMNRYFASHLVLQVKFGFEWPWSHEIRCAPSQDTLNFGKLLDVLWQTRPQPTPKPTKVSVTLMGLIHASNHTPSLFETPQERQRAKLLQTLDQIKERYGSRSIYYGNAMLAQKMAEAAPMRIAFNHIPDLTIERD